jgi:riboflavin kinase/FMN adenylyltransferase
MNPQITIIGNVINGQKRGRLLGFPTANLLINENISEGIYAAEVLIENKTYKSAAFVGKALTFNEFDIKLECYILDFDENIYGKNISVKLYKKIRGNKKFNGEKELIEQMNKDVESVRKFFKLAA